MNPDLVLVLAVFSLAGAAGMALSAASSSTRTFRPAFVLLTLGLVLWVTADAMTPDTYGLGDVPQAFLRLFQELSGP